MIRVKLEEIQIDDQTKNGSIACMIKNRGYEDTITFIDDPHLQVATYSISDPVGNPIECLNRKIKKNPSHTTIDAGPGEYVQVDTWSFNYERYIGHTATHYWDLSPYRGKSFTITAHYQIGEELQALFQDQFNKEVTVCDEISKSLSFELPG